MKKSSQNPDVLLQAMRAITLFLMTSAGIISSVAAETGEPYAAQLEALRSEITAKLPAIEEAARKSNEGDKDEDTVSR